MCVYVCVCVCVCQRSSHKQTPQKKHEQTAYRAHPATENAHLSECCSVVRELSMAAKKGSSASEPHLWLADDGAMARMLFRLGDALTDQFETATKMAAANESHWSVFARSQ